MVHNKTCSKKYRTYPRKSIFLRIGLSFLSCSGGRHFSMFLPAAVRRAESHIGGGGRCCLLKSAVPAYMRKDEMLVEI